VVDAELLAAFRGGRNSNAGPCGEPELTTVLGSLLEHARGHGLPQDDAHAFVAYLGQRCEAQDALAFLERLDVEATTLAFACRDGDDAALRRFEATYFREVEVGASRLRCSPDELDEIQQATREALFSAGPGGGPRVLEMTGRGDLRALIRLIALRAGISRRRRQGRHASDGDDAILALEDLGPTASVALVKAEHRARFSAALEAAIGRLEPKSRTLLRMYELDGVDQSALARMHRVDRSTIARWLARARKDLLGHTRRELEARFGVRHGELDSFLDVLRSGFDVSVFRLLEQGSPR
jgi:RNA polymerase sigma-70 factor (ECF subfamily)